MVQSSTERGAAGVQSDRQVILVVDDDADFRELLAEHLEGTGRQVRTAADGAEALASLGSGTDAIGLVLLDLRMPGMDGFELCRRVDRLPEVAVPVIVMTAEHETRGIAGSRCVVAVVHKPLDLLRLEALVEEHLAV